MSGWAWSRLVLIRWRASAILAVVIGANSLGLAIGIDVMHQSPRSAQGTLSIVVFIASINSDFVQFLGCVSLQKSRREVGHVYASIRFSTDWLGCRLSKGLSLETWLSNDCKHISDTQKCYLSAWLSFVMVYWNDPDAGGSSMPWSEMDCSALSTVLAMSSRSNGRLLTHHRINSSANILS